MRNGHIDSFISVPGFLVSSFFDFEFLSNANSTRIAQNTNFVNKVLEAISLLGLNYVVCWLYFCKK